VEENQGTGLSERIGQILAVPILIATITGIVLVLQGADPGPLKPKADPGFLDLIFGNRTVLLFVRAALIIAAVYVLISVVALVVRRNWLIRAGPFQASDQDIRTLKEAAEYWQAEAFAQAQQVHELTERVEETDKLVENLVSSLDRGEGEGPSGPTS
jgi:hypothetical protein